MCAVIVRTLAYHYALAYPPLERPPLEISESIRMRGRTEQQDTSQPKKASKPEGKSRSRERNRNDKKRNSNQQRSKQERAHENDTNQFQ